MKLVHLKTKKPVKVGDKVKDFRGEHATVIGIELPKHAGSTGRVIVKMKDWEHGYYPSVYNMEWIDREDRKGK